MVKAGDGQIPHKGKCALSNLGNFILTLTGMVRLSKAGKSRREKLYPETLTEHENEGWLAGRHKGVKRRLQALSKTAEQIKGDDEKILVWILHIWISTEELLVGFKGVMNESDATLKYRRSKD